MTRYRTQESSKEAVATYEGSFWYTEDALPSVYTSLSLSKEMWDTETPQFHSKIRRGEIVNNPCTYVVESITSDVPDNFGVSTISKYSNPPLTWSPCNFTRATMDRHGYPSTVYWNDPQAVLSMDNAIANTKQQCLGNVDPTPYGFFEDLAEIRETLELLRNPLSGINKLARRFWVHKKRIRDLKNAAKQAKAYADLWNQYRFAFAPLVRSLLDVWDALETWEDIERPSRQSAHYKSDIESDVVEFPKQHNGPNGALGYFYYKSAHKSVANVHSTILYEVKNPLTDWKFKLGLRSKDIPTVAWEVIPLSFMVDRLLDVKSFVQGLTNLADPNVAFLAASTTTRRVDKVETQLVQHWWGNGGVFRHMPTNAGVVVYDKFTYDRQVWDPGLDDTIPVLNWKGLVEDAAKTTDLIAIIISRLL